MTGRSGNGIGDPSVVAVTPFNVAEAFSRLNLRARSTWIAVGALTAIADRDRFERPRMNDAAVGLDVVHALWRHIRSGRAGGRHDRVTAWTDLAARAAGFSLVSAAAAPEDQFDLIANWVFAVALYDVADAALTLDPFEASLVGVLTAALYTKVTLRRARGTGTSTAMANAIQIVMFTAGGIWVRRVVRRGEAEFEAINARYRAERAEAARQYEIDVASRHLVGAVRAAAADVGELLTFDRPGARQRAAAIATQLRAVLSKPEDAPGGTFSDAVIGAVVDAAADGLMVETTFRIDAEVDATVVDPLVAALRAALRNITDHASAERAVLRVVVDAAQIQMTLRDRGRGGGPLQATDLPAVRAALSGLDATVELDSSPDRGTRIRIVVPT